MPKDEDVLQLVSVSVIKQFILGSHSYTKHFFMLLLYLNC